MNDPEILKLVQTSRNMISETRQLLNRVWHSEIQNRQKLEQTKASINQLIAVDYHDEDNQNFTNVVSTS